MVVGAIVLTFAGNSGCRRKTDAPISTASSDSGAKDNSKDVGPGSAESTLPADDTGAETDGAESEETASSETIDGAAPPAEELGGEESPADESAPSESIVTESNETETAESPTPVEPIDPTVVGIAEVSSGQYEWGPGGRAVESKAQVFFDNGTSARLRITFGQAGEVPVTGEGLTRLVVDTGVSYLSFQVLSEDGTVAFEYAGQCEPGIYVYNHQAAWDYKIETANYSAPNAFGDVPDTAIYVPGPRVIEAPLFLHLTDIDYPFTYLPQQINVDLSSIDTDRTNLVHNVSSANVDRSARRLESADGRPMWLVSSAGDRVSLQEVGTELWGQPILYVDNIETAESHLQIDGQEITQLPPYGLLRVQLPIGQHSVRLATAAGETMDEHATFFQAGYNYVFAPFGHRSYTLEYQRYADDPAVFQLMQQTEPLSCRGLRFFRPRADYYFDPFPETIPGSRFSFAQELSRLTRGISDTAVGSSLQAEYDQVRADAAAQLGADAAINLDLELQATVDYQHLSECDVWIARGLWLAAQDRADEAVQEYSKVLKFQTNRARVFRLRGLIYSQQKKYQEAINDFRDAILADESLREELDPLRTQLENKL
jgi:tetratricopeptide (TPR) repeat protein